MEIREATATDWTAIWPILRTVAAAGETYAWPVDITEDAGRAAWMKEPPGRTFVAIDDGALVGTAFVKPNQDGNGSHVANAGFLVDPRHSGRGVARALCDRVLAEAKRDGYRAMQFNAVVETNIRAVELWRSYGFEVLATIPEAFRHPVHGYVGLHLMYRML